MTSAESRGERQGEEIFALCMQKREDGSQRFSNQEIRHFLPLIIISAGFDVSKHPPLQAVMSEFIPKLGVAANADAETYSRAIQRYYRANPPNKELEREFLAYCRSQAITEVDAEKVRAFAKASGMNLGGTSPLKGMAAPTGGVGLRRR